MDLTLPRVISLPSRAIGAFSGAILALLVIVALNLLSKTDPMIGEATPLRLLLEPQLVPGSPVVVLPDGTTWSFQSMVGWAIPPVSAAFTGWILSNRAITSRFIAGIAMGVVTFLVTDFLGTLAILWMPILLMADPMGGRVDGLLIVAAAAVGAIGALDLLPVCLVAGLAWSYMVSMVAGPRSHPPNADATVSRADHG